MSSTRVLYIDAAPDPVFAIFHPAAPDARLGSAVLICPPWGWEEVASYRSRREWAERLAAAGHPTLRFALPATGNSGGSPRDPGLVAAWIAAVDGGVRWLREQSGAPRLAALGLGLGGLLARAALAGGTPIDELALWGAPASGRAFVRETRAFSRLQDWHGGGGFGNGEGLPVDWLEAGGFLLSAETLVDLDGLGAELPVGPPLRRALLLERDGVAVDSGLHAGLETAGVEVETAAGPGWAELVSDVEQTRLTEETVARVAAWLDAATGNVDTAAAAAPVALEEVTLAVDGAQVRERPLRLGQELGGEAFGVLTEPVSGPRSPLFAVCLNAGAVHNIGPHRIWADTARRWAARGVGTLRLDLEGIGEASGVAPRAVEDFYVPKFERQLRLVLRRLRELGVGERFVLVGLCAGGYWGFRAALDDSEHVEAALLMNAGALVWEDDLIGQRKARKLSRASEAHWWGKLIRGEVSLAQLAELGRSLLTALSGGLSRLLRGRRSRRSEIEADLDRLGAAGIELTLGFSGGEPLSEELRLFRLLDRPERWPWVVNATLPGEDHTLRPPVAQIATRELLDRGLERALARVSAKPRQGPAAPAGRQR